MACTGSLRQRVFNGDDKIDILQVLFQPALNAGVQFLHVLEHNRAFGVGVEGQDGIAAKFPHAGAQPEAGFGGKQVAMKGLSRQGARDRAVRTDHPQVESQLLHDGQGKSVAPSRDHHHLNPFRMGPA